MQEPEKYGIPVLFPPNRIDKGQFIFEDRKYCLPLNEPHRGNHLHGLVLGKPWELAECSPEHIAVEYNHKATEGFPHDFTLGLKYCFAVQNIKQEIYLINNSDKTMPFGLGFHTCFICSGKDTVTVTADGRWEVLPPRYLSTGKFFKYASTLMEHDNTEAVSKHYRMTTHQFPENKFRGAIIKYADINAQVLYEVADDFQHWCLWNSGGSKGFFCPEPMTWMVDAPNMDIPAETTGIRKLPSNEKWNTWTNISVKRMKPSIHNTSTN